MAMKDDKIVRTTTYRDKKGKRKFYDISGIAVDESGNGVGTIQTPTTKQRKQMAAEQDRRNLGIKTVEQTQKTLQNANREFDLASKRYENALSNELKKTGIDYRTRFEDMSKKKISYQTKNEDKPKNQPTPIPIVETSKKIKKELEAKNKAEDKVRIAEYENNLAKVYDEKTTNADRWLYPVRKVAGMFDNLGEVNAIYDEKGNKTFLPSYTDLKNEKVRQDTSGLAGVAMDITGEGAKILTSAGVDLLTGGIGGKALYWSDMAADNYKNVINQGYDKSSAIANTIINTGSEFLTEKLMGGLAKPLTGAKVSETQKVFANAFAKATKNPRIANILGSMTSEGLEEFTQEFIGALNNKITLGQDTNIEDLVQDALYSGLIGMGTGGFVTGAMGNVEGKIAQQNYNAMGENLSDLYQLRDTSPYSERVNEAIQAGENYQRNVYTADYEKTMEKVNNLNEVEREALTEITRKRLAGEMLDQNDLDTINYLNNRDEMQTDLASKVQEGTQPQTLKPTDTSDKLLNFRNSVENEGIQDAEGFYKAAEKIIQDKGYNVILDSSIKNEKGKPVNAVISNENGITIRINPKSNRAGEILLTHEITHGIETKTMSDLIMNYAQKDAKFNEALQSLKKAYGTEDITPEVVADISGQLFGNQEFISNLKTENPSIFKQIYDIIIDLANKITGNSNEALFIRDLQNKWEKAYRESTIESSRQNLKEGAKYSKNAETSEAKNVFETETNNNVKTNRTTDNKGTKLTKDQQDFYEDSKIRDENGALIRVYHTVNHPIVQFNEFNPIGTPRYRFGDQIVIYSTSSKEMSGSYSDQVYDMAEGEKLNTIKEAQKWLNSVRPDLNLKIDGLDVFEEYDGGFREDILSYESENDLLRNLKSDIQKEYGNEGPLQYEAYLNMKNPFIVESKGKKWDEVAEELNEVKADIVNRLKENHRTEIVELAKESKEKYKEFRDGQKKKNLEFSSDILGHFKKVDLSEFFEDEMGVGSDWADLHEYFHADDYEDFLSNFEMYHRVLNREAMQKAMEEQGITQEDFDKMSDEEKTRFEEQFEENKPVYEYDVELPDADEKLSDLIDKDTLDFYEEKGDSIPFFKNLKNKTFGEFMDNLFELYDESSYFEDEHSWFDAELDLDEMFGVGADDIFEGDTLYKLGESNFDQDYIDMLTKDPLETNDVVKMIIAENKSKPENERYDGIIFKGIYDYGGHADRITPEDVFVVFNPNQIKSVENKHPTNDPDWRYSQYVNKWQKWLDEKFPSRGTTTNLKEHIKTKAEIKKDMIDKGVKPKVAQIMTETPRPEEKKSSLREDWHKLKRKFVDKGEAVYRLSKKTKNRLLYAMYDKMGTSVGEANYHIGEAQTTLKGNVYRNFTDKNGKKVSMSLNQIWDGIDPKLANEYLAHYLNMDRYKQKNLSGENRYVFGESITDKDSAKRIKELEKAHPELKRFGENVWQYGRNQLKNMVDSGLISKEQAEQFVLDTPHYVRLQRNVSKGSKNKIEVDKNGNAAVNKQIKEFKGSDLDILPFKDTMAQYTLDVIQSMRANLFGQELAKTLGMSSTNDTVDSVDEIFGFNPDLIKDNEDGTYSFTIFNKGQAITLPIDEGIYEALQPNKKYDIEDAAIFSGKFGIRNADKFRRSLLTDKNPLFLATNMLKDLFDAPLNSQRPTAFVANYIPAIKQIVTNGKYYQQYKSLGGLQNTYFDSKEGFKKQRNKLNPVGWFEKANNAVEQFPRLAEFMATMKATGNIDEAMYNAAEITTNFKRGGDITKAINRNGGTFLNASVQGFSRFVRNFSDIQNPQQAVKMLAKIVALGIGPALLNDMVYDDDDEYKDLQDYIKDNYYLIKGKNGTWIRIPKGRAVSVFQDAARRTKYALKGDKDAYKGMWSTFKNQIAPNNVFDSNIASPFVQVAKNKSWSGNPIVSDYTKNEKHPEEEYDVKTDELSKWLGKTFHLSPKKINYIIDQYSGVIGDFALPMGTKYAESKSDSALYQALVNPALNKFTTNSVTSSKAQQQFYQALQDAEDDRYWSKGTTKDTAVHKYLSSKNREISAIRSEMTKLQESNKPDSEKFEGALEYQKQINEIAKDAVKQAKKVNSTGEEFVIGGKYYSGPEANAVKSETVEKAKNIGLSVGDYIDVTAKYSDLKADKDSNGKTIPGSKKQKFIDYVNSKKELTTQQKIAIIQKYYKKYEGE